VLHPDEVLTYIGRQGGGYAKDELLPVYHRFKKSDGTFWDWSRTTGELLDGWLTEA
jgi:hypothetical protein